MSQVVAAQWVCPHCRAENSPDNKLCWLCRAPLGKEPVTAELAAKPRPLPLAEGFFWTLTIACLGLLVLVGVGIAQDDAGMLIPYAILLTPALLATLVRSLVSASRGKRVSGKEVFMTLLLSASVTILVVVGLFVAAIAALFAYCVYVCGGGGKF